MCLLLSFCSLNAFFPNFTFMHIKDVQRASYCCLPVSQGLKTFDPDVIWTRNLLIWSQTRYRCATESWYQNLLWIWAWYQIWSGLEACAGLQRVIKAACILNSSSELASHFLDWWSELPDLRFCYFFALKSSAGSAMTETTDSAVTRIRTWVVSATTRSTNHYTITAIAPAEIPCQEAQVPITFWCPRGSHSSLEMIPLTLAKPNPS